MKKEKMYKRQVFAYSIFTAGKIFPKELVHNNQGQKTSPSGSKTPEHRRAGEACYSNNDETLLIGLCVFSVWPW